MGNENLVENTVFDSNTICWESKAVISIMN